MPRTQACLVSFLMSVMPAVAAAQGLEAGRIGAALLIQRDADVNALSARRYSALLVAAQYPGSTETIRALLARGARVGVPGNKGKPAANASPVFFASHAGNETILPTLLKAGARRDARDTAGLTAADYARQYHHDELAGLLK